MKKMEWSAVAMLVLGIVLLLRAQQKHVMTVTPPGASLAEAVEPLEPPIKSASLHISPPPASIRPVAAALAEHFSAQWLQEQSSQMNSIDSHPQETLARLKEMAASLSDSERDQLMQKVVDASADQNERALGLHLLTLTPKTSAETYIHIALMDDPSFHTSLPGHSSDEFQRNLVEALAVGALDELQTRALQNPAFIGELEHIAKKSPSPLVARVSQAMAKAVLSGQPIIAEAQ